MQDERENRRESIWSIRQLSLVRYYIAFAILFALVTGLYLWRGFATALPGAHAVDTALAALKEASGLIPWLIVFTFYLVEGISMLAERYLKSRYDKGTGAGRGTATLAGLESAAGRGLAGRQGLYRVAARRSCEEPQVAPNSLRP